MKEMRKLKIMPNSYVGIVQIYMYALFILVFLVGVAVIDVIYVIYGLADSVRGALYIVYGGVVMIVIPLSRKYRAIGKGVDDGVCKQAVSKMRMYYVLLSVLSIISQAVSAFITNTGIYFVVSVVPMFLICLSMIQMAILERKSVGSWRVYSDEAECTGNRRDYTHIQNGVKINLYNGTTINVDLETQGVDFVGTHTLLLYEDLNVTEAVPAVYTMEDVRDIEIISLSGEITHVFLGSKRFSVLVTEGTE